jgi:hypothetical protein
MWRNGSTHLQKCRGAVALDTLVYSFYTEQWMVEAGGIGI